MIGERWHAIEIFITNVTPYHEPPLRDALDEKMFEHRAVYSLGLKRMDSCDEEVFFLWRKALFHTILPYIEI